MVHELLKNFDPPCDPETMALERIDKDRYQLTSDLLPFQDKRGYRVVNRRGDPPQATRTAKWFTEVTLDLLVHSCCVQKDNQLVVSESVSVDFKATEYALAVCKTGNSSMSSSKLCKHATEAMKDIQALANTLAPGYLVFGVLESERNPVLYEDCFVGIEEESRATGIEQWFDESGSLKPEIKEELQRHTDSPLPDLEYGGVVFRRKYFSCLRVSSSTPELANHKDKGKVKICIRSLQPQTILEDTERYFAPKLSGLTNFVLANNK